MILARTVEVNAFSKERYSNSLSGYELKTLDFESKFYPTFDGQGWKIFCFLLRRMQVEYLVKGKHLHICFVDLQKACDYVQRR